MQPKSSDDNGKGSGGLAIPQFVTPTAAGCEATDEASDAGPSRQVTRLGLSENNALLASLAHELKTPLAIVSGYIEILREGKPGSLNEDQRRLLADAAENCVRLKKFVEQFLSHAALNAQKVRMRLELGDLNQCLAEVCCLWRQQVLAKRLALYFHPDATLEPFLYDNDKIQHVVSNLLDNALKFTPSGGTIWLTSERSSLELEAAEGGTGAGERERPNSIPAARVVVADTGQGIPAEFRTEVFQEFFRMPNHEGNSNGTGLGLSIAKRLVQLHGGRIWIESEPGAGTHACFMIPMRKESESANESVEARSQ